MTIRIIMMKITKLVTIIIIIIIIMNNKNNDSSNNNNTNNKIVIILVITKTIMIRIQINDLRWSLKSKRLNIPKITQEAVYAR